MNYYLAGSVTWDFMFQWCSRYRINCRCSLDISQCKTLNELSMGNAHINLSMGNSQGRDMGLNCLTMEIVSTLNGHPLSGMEGWQKNQWKCGHLPNLPLQPTPKSSLVYFRLKKAFFPLQIEPLMLGRSQLPSVKHVLGVLEWSYVVPKKCFLYQLLWLGMICFVHPFLTWILNGRPHS